LVDAALRSRVIRATGLGIPGLIGQAAQFAATSNARTGNSLQAECWVPRRFTLREGKATPMFLILAIVLVVLWLGGFLMFHTAGFLIHLLLLFAVISLVIHFVTGRTAA
jgi:hypothetical protein